MTGADSCMETPFLHPLQGTYAKDIAALLLNSLFCEWIVHACL